MRTPLRHYLQFKDLTADDYAYLFQRAGHPIKARKPGPNLERVL